MSSKSRWFGLMYLKQEKVFWDAKAKTIFHDKTTKSTRSMKYDKENTSFGNFFWNITLNHECHGIKFHFMILYTIQIIPIYPQDIYKYILSTNKNEKGINPRKLSRETKWSILLATFFYARPYFTTWIDGLDIILFILKLAFKTIKSLIKCCFCI